MNKIGKVLLGIISLVICFGLSAFGMYEYNNYKAFNSLASQGKQYMLQKDYDKAIQAFQQALNYKNDSDIQTNIALAQNLKNENSIKGTISKNIQLANEAAKNNKYDEANKYLDEVLKVDPNNSEAKSLKDTYSKAVQKQQEKIKAEAQAENQQKQTSSTSEDDSIENSLKKNGEITYEQAVQLAKKYYPYCSFKPAEEVMGVDGLNAYIPHSNKYRYCYFLYGHNYKYIYDLEGIIAVDRVNTHIYAIMPNNKIEIVK